MEITKGENIMKYYDSTSGKVRNTLEETLEHPRYNAKLAKVRNIFAFIVILFMMITVSLQLIWYNIILHTALCSIIITLSLGTLICDLVQKDMKSIVFPTAWMTFWLTNLAICWVKYLLS